MSEEHVTSREFCYWLQGYFELANATYLPVEQTEMIKKHLSMVFKHEIDPSYGDDKHQADLTSIHGSGPTGPLLMRC